MTDFPIADTVIYRHPCDCETASRPLANGEQPEHRFDVNGQPFPWHITPDGAQFEQHGGIYVVRLTLYPMLAHNHEMCTITTEYQRPPLITPTVNTAAAQYFPWLITGPIKLTQNAADDIPMMQLAFLAQHIDVDCQVADITREAEQPAQDTQCESYSPMTGEQCKHRRGHTGYHRRENGSEWE